MAWLARSIANSLKLDEDDSDDEPRLSGDESAPNQSVSESQSPRGVKEDISELTKTLRSQFWGVASFLSQPSSSPYLQERNQQSPEEDEDLIAGIRNDFAEIGGRFRTGISKLSENLPVSDFTKIASNFLQLGSEGVDPKDYDDVIGVTEELVAFVRDLAIHPETWLDLPLPNEEDDDTFDDFEMSDDQHDHALAVERLVPSLASLRIELCPEYMSENCFWMIYFVLLHPKLNQHDALLLSTPQVLEARAMLSHELEKINRAPVEEGESSGANAAVVEPLDNPSQESLVAETVNPQDYETEKHTIESTEIQVVDKSVIEERNSSTDSSSSSRFINVQAEDVEEEEEDADDWLNDEETSDATVSGGMEGGVTTKHPLDEDEEDVSFSDLEEDDEEGDVPLSSKKSTNCSSPDWVQI